MSQLTYKERYKAIQRYEPIELYGLTFHPIYVKDYEDYAECKSALLLRQSTLPASYISMPFLSAVWAYEQEQTRTLGKPIGLVAAIVKLLCLALQIPADQRSRAYAIRANFSEDGNTLKSFVIRQGEVMATISAAQFNKVRELIANQNGDELPDESENPELIQAGIDFGNASGAKVKLKHNVDDLIASVASIEHDDEEVIRSEWCIRKFELRRRAIDRRIGHIICTLGEYSGNVKWKGGNPYPSLWYDRDADNTGLLNAREWRNSIGDAVGEVDSLPNIPI